MSRALSKTQLKQIVNAITKHYPAGYADKAWDNTGLHIDCSVDGDSNIGPAKVLLAVDLTASVAQEAIDKGCNLILAYHPFIFPSWKSLNPSRNTQQNSAIKLIQEGISVYCPHTSVDAAKGGVNDWLANGLVGKNTSLISSNISIEQISGQLVGGDLCEEVGYGRLVKLGAPLSLQDIIENVKASLGIKHVQVSSLHSDLSNHKIKNIALCAGSGSGVFKALSEDVDLYYTGELSHHEILRYKESGKAVIVCNHSNTERGYLKAEMVSLLTQKGIECIVIETDVNPLRVV
ncbi:hypothetical protein Kpol_423p6 [Vanderwaltozyma polyspora DSM 70294]|uniref:YbgI/family dinuclear metal center protein n=1 Tax=Vanderwaltozyma polyspora (strain ATCC 22028 / DSM 70294 / BCRC 21397 / CBS 2163 / NBRC 10782 / NRRL Y-8283 / UCD 57-17) TaxID=436907 RepID=A7TR83_VANPO|nr:uncharacterized protein Kpol_423p6 [Vanderwaltozyma polyspora DSM 70294]EDO15216.1 hypothetical protein Kpol_423p6 [Vanderwaltozyma polyspora DSM 70294]